MDEKSESLWKMFTALERQFPECQALKLTIELQRWFIHHRQRAILDSMHAMLAQADPIRCKAVPALAIAGGADFEFKRDIGKCH
jgi:hypothetical protein